MSTCDKRGHYYLPIDLPAQTNVNGFWSILPPSPQRKLYCRRCGKVTDLVIESPWGTITSTGTTRFSSTFTLLTNPTSSSWVFTLE